MKIIFQADIIFREVISLTRDEALKLFTDGDLLELGKQADSIRKKNSATRRLSSSTEISTTRTFVRMNASSARSSAARISAVHIS